MTKLSIIVPVYNVQMYLEKCLDSVIRQKNSDYEILLIDDGSTDDSGSICDRYAQLANNIKVVHKQNGGLSSARNCGIEKAVGEYLVFIDSDDSIEDNTFASFCKTLEKSGNPDLLITFTRKIYDEEGIVKEMDQNLPIEKMRDQSVQAYIRLMFRNSNNLWPAQRYIVKRSTIIANNLKFADGFLHEDIDWTTRLFLSAKSITYSRLYWYNHKMSRSGSITSTTNPKRTLDVITLVSKSVNLLNDIEISVDIRNIICRRLVKSVFYSLRDFSMFSENDKESVISCLNINKHIFKYTYKIRHLLFILVCKMFGFKVGLFLLAIRRQK